jgi:glutamate dehydrogenase/leucine dehydrogenase
MDGEPRIWRNHVIADENFALVVQTRHAETIATTAVHQQAFSRRIGGVRCVESSNEGKAADGLVEVGHLSSTMTEKCMAAMIPADGQKSVVVTTPDVMHDEAKKVEILAAHERIVARLDPGVIFGPDMAVPEAVQDALSRHDGLLDHVTGLSSRNSGLSIDDNGYTGLGVAEAIQTVYPGAALEGRTLSIQGFGAVGAHTARLMSQAGARVVAVSNALGVLVAENGATLDVEAMFHAWEMERSDEWIGSYAAPGARLIRDPNQLFEVPADIFVPAARTSVLVTTGEMGAVENPDARDAREFLKRTGVKLVAEGANHPLSAAAEEYLEQHGVVILPDYIINCGGLIGCWVEWEARHNGNPEDVSRIAAQARERVRNTVRENVAELRRAPVPARAAASDIASRNRAKLINAKSDRNITG